MSTTDSIAKEVAVRVGDVNFEQLREIKRYVEDVVTELTMALRKGSVLYTTTLTTDSNNKVTLPDGCFSVLRVAGTSGNKYEVVDLNTFRQRQDSQSSLSTAYVQENVPNWTIEIINSGSSASIKIDYLVTTGNPNILPEYYESIIKAGTEAFYHLRHSPRDQYLVFLQEYNRLKSLYLENQEYNDSSVDQMKSLDQISAESGNSNTVINNNYVNVRGFY